MDLTITEKYFNENERFLNTGENSDVIIYAGVKPNIKEIYVHSFILQVHCPFFRNALTNATKKNGYYIFEKPNISEPIFKPILKFLYTSKIELDKFTGVDILEILIVANELGLKSLYEHAMNYFIVNHEDYIKENPVGIIKSICSNEEIFKELKNIYLETFCEYSEELFESSEFQSLEKPILLEILKRDDFSVDEIVIWENIIEWGLARHPEIDKNNNVEDWPLQKFSFLKNTLKEFIPLIRFQDISSKDFSNKILPYQKIFPRTFWKLLLQHRLVPDEQNALNLLPSRNPKIKSTFSELGSLTINRKVTLLFSSWIDGKNQPYTSFRDVKYKFELLYCSSKDGLSYVTFHQKCDNINRTLVVGKIQNSEQLVGGYNPLNWNGNDGICIYKNTTESFIFNISNRNDIKNAQFSYVINDDFDNAVYCSFYNLPIFGGGCDIVFNTNGIIRSNIRTYNNINIVNNSVFDELQVFRIIDKD